ncbi:hypothetical protein EHQ59_07605 [Leptospira kemamanensis]|uniref:Uncharacterized protein n=1 Tax=Leptospira kemamanensis TaxID=2484942 RepID=A0A4R9JQ50_9LEPT|nr:hypothetical protein [Leptospira kemamanensis]TGL54051.1 hypothetical protein EHQ59_07605 [Leptospira kemamanensis]
MSPNTEERSSRGVPFFYDSGKMVVGYRFSKELLPFFIMKGNVLMNLNHHLKDHSASSTVTHFDGYRGWHSKFRIYFIDGIKFSDFCIFQE